MENIEKRKEEFNILKQEFDPTVRDLWSQISKIEGDKSCRRKEKINKIKDLILQEAQKVC